MEYWWRLTYAILNIVISNDLEWLSKILTRSNARPLCDSRATCYEIALLASFSVNAVNKFGSCYHKCVELCVGCKKYDSVTGVLLDTGLPSFNTILHNAMFNYKCISCENTVVKVSLVVTVIVYCLFLTPFLSLCVMFLCVLCFLMLWAFSAWNKRLIWLIDWLILRI